MGDSSRVVPIATPSTTNMLAPYFSACMPKRYASTMPMRKVTSTTTGIASMQTCLNWTASSFPRSARGRSAASPSAAAERPRKSRWPSIRARKSKTCMPSSASAPWRVRGASMAISSSRPLTASITRRWLTPRFASCPMVAPAPEMRRNSASAAAVSSRVSAAPSSTRAEAGMRAAARSASISAIRGRCHAPERYSVACPSASSSQHVRAEALIPGRFPGFAYGGFSIIGRGPREKGRRQQ